MKSVKRTPKNILLLLVMGIFLFPGCSEKQDDPPINPPELQSGEIEKITTLADYSTEEIQQILLNGNIDVPFELKYDVKVLAIEYTSRNSSGDIIRVSGAFAIPQSMADLPLMSLQHGTISHRDHVASSSPANSTEGFIGLITAAMGYFTVIPDYAGFGISKGIHPYIHAESCIPNVIDFLKAAESYCSDNSIELNGQLFLTGYSEGGYLTLATQKNLEENPLDAFNLTAVAPLSGPYDLKGMCDSILFSTNYVSPTYIAYFITAYNNIYGWNRLDDFFQAQYASQVNDLFNGSMEWGEIVQQMPNSIQGLLRESFIENYNTGEEKIFTAAIEENTLLNWGPKTPIHFFHGDEDLTVPYYNTITAIEELSKQGSSTIQFTTIEGGNHETSGPVAVFGALTWIETYRNESK